MSVISTPESDFSDKFDPMICAKSYRLKGGEAIFCVRYIIKINEYCAEFVTTNYPRRSMIVDRMINMDPFSILDKNTWKEFNDWTIGNFTRGVYDHYMIQLFGTTYSLENPKVLCPLTLPLPLPLSDPRYLRMVDTPDTLDTLDTPDMLTSRSDGSGSSSPISDEEVMMMGGIMMGGMLMDVPEEYKHDPLMYYIKQDQERYGHD
jgi:hypothetical protein